MTMYYEQFSYSIERLVNDLTTISIRLSEEEKKALQKFAKEHDLTISQVVRRAIKDLLLLDKLAEEFNKIPN